VTPLKDGRRSAGERAYLKWFSRLWDATARRRKLSIALTAAIPLLGRLLLLAVQPIPVPATHDEFSYLLAAETFARGHLTNPPPPMWQHFESFHELMQPTYMSVYPPGQGAMLAAGILLFGNPWWAVWISVGVMCASLTWMLQAWLPQRWALLGGVLAGLQFGFEHYWMNSYWGGSLAAIGGCLALGGFGRLRRRPQTWHSILLGTGLMIVACTRPFEGLVLTLAMFGAALIWFQPRYREPGFVKRFVLRNVLPAFVPLSAGLILLAIQARASVVPARSRGLADVCFRTPQDPGDVPS